MSLSSSPKLLKGGLVVLDPSGAVQRTIAMQINPDSLACSYQVQGVGGEGGGPARSRFA